MSDFNKYKNFAVGTFFSAATIIMISSAYIVYTQWQHYWTEGFKDFKSISAAIVELKETAKPISDITPDVLSEMKIMNKKISQMNDSVQQMDMAVNGINSSVYNMSYTVPNRMDNMRNDMNMWDMVTPFN
jgi:hypothetical protein